MMGQQGPEDDASTFSTLQTPNIEKQRHAQRQIPKSTSAQTMPPKRTYKIRRIPASDTDIAHTFKAMFKKEQFRGQQEAIMKAAVQGLDILVIAPTGLGKSLCFQVPAIADRHGVTIVICPLISLMTDQVDSLRRLGLPATMLTSTTDEETAKKIYKDLKCGHPKTRLLYVTPERVSSESFQKKLAIVYKQNELARFVIDESHCIEEWGQTFRKSYTQLGKLRELFPKVPIMALTASATDHVADNIIETLGMDREFFLKITHPFNRANLFYEVRYVKEGAESKIENIAKFIKKEYSRASIKTGETSNGQFRPISGIIYARAKATCDYIADALKKKGIRAATYHRGMKPELAQITQDRWLQNDVLRDAGKPHVDCIVATVAFGMGIDKANCRYVIHYDLPKSFEGYYQETGRAGRDGHAARVLLYYSSDDEHRVVYYAAENARKLHKTASETGEDSTAGKHAAESIKKSWYLQLAGGFCQRYEDVQTCARKQGQYFGEEVTEADASNLCERFCDVCRNSEKVESSLRAALVEFNPAATQRLQKEGCVEVQDSSVSDNDLEMFSPQLCHQSKKRRGAEQQAAPTPSKRPRLLSLKPVQDHDMGLQEEPVSLAADKLRKKFAYKAPFRKEMDPAELSALKKADATSSSLHPSPPQKYTLQPPAAMSNKNIPEAIRDEAISSLDKHLCRIIMSKYGNCSKEEEEATFAKIDFDNHVEKRAVILEAVCEMESDIMWTVLTLSGYKDSIERCKADLPAGGCYDALERAARLVKQRMES